MRLTAHLLGRRFYQAQRQHGALAGGQTRHGLPSARDGLRRLPLLRLLPPGEEKT